MVSTSAPTVAQATRRYSGYRCEPARQADRYRAAMRAESPEPRSTGTPPSPRTATPPRSPTEIELAWQDRWEAEGTFHAPNPTGPLSDGFDRVADRPEAVRARHVPVPVRRRAARRPPARLHRHRRLRPLQADDRAQRPAHDGLRRLRPARRAVRRRRPARTHGSPPRPTSPSCAPAAAPRPRPRRPPRVATTDVGFYRWTQWIFLQIFGTWYDADADRARPIAELEAELDAGTRQPAEGTNPSELPVVEPRRRRAPAGRRRPPPRLPARGAGQLVPRARARCSPTRRSPPTAAPNAATSPCSGAR